MRSTYPKLSRQIYSMAIIIAGVDTLSINVPWNAPVKTSGEFHQSKFFEQKFPNFRILVPPKAMKMASIFFNDNKKNFGF